MWSSWAVKASCRQWYCCNSTGSIPASFDTVESEWYEAVLNKIILKSLKKSPFLIWRSNVDMHSLNPDPEPSKENIQHLKKLNFLALKKIKFLNCFIFLWVIFALLGPDPQHCLRLMSTLPIFCLPVLGWSGPNTWWIRRRVHWISLPSCLTLPALLSQGILTQMSQSV